VPAPLGDRPDVSTLLRYAALQIPGWALAGVAAWAAIRWADLQPWLAYLGVGAWVLKDVVMFRFVWRSYAAREGNGLHDIRGRVGTVEETLAPEGRVRVGSERWRAVCDSDSEPIAVGVSVRVVDIHGLRLTVEALGGPEAGG